MWWHFESIKTCFRNHRQKPLSLPRIFSFEQTKQSKMSSQKEDTKKFQVKVSPRARGPIYPKRKTAAQNILLGV